MEMANKRTLETVLLENIEGLSNTRIGNELRKMLLNRVNVANKQYGDLIYTIDLEKFKIFAENSLKNLKLKVNENVFSHISYFPIISLQYVSLSSFQIWTQTDISLSTNNVYAIEGTYSFLTNSYKYYGKPGNNKEDPNNARVIRRLNVSKHNFEEYKYLILYLLLASISPYTPPDIFHDLGYVSFLGDNYSGFVGFSLYFAKAIIDKIYDRFDEGHVAKIKIFNKNLLSNGGKVYEVCCSIDGQLSQLNKIYSSWKVFKYLESYKKDYKSDKNNGINNFYPLILRIYRIGTSIEAYDIIIGEVKDLLDIISFNKLELNKIISCAENEELYLLLASISKIKNGITSIDQKIPGASLEEILTHKYEYSECIKDFIKNLKDKENINVYDLSVVLHNELLDNRSKESKKERLKRLESNIKLINNLKKFINQKLAYT